MAGVHTFDDIDRAASALEAMVNSVDVAALPGAGASKLSQRLVKAERVLAACRARAIKRAADTNQWRRAGERSPAAWAAKLTGTSVGQAAAELETTEQLEALPATHAARASGELSELQAKEAASAATADPSAEAELLRRVKIDDAKAFKARCAAVRAAAERDEAAARERIRKARRFRSWTDAEGAFCFAGRGLAEDGAALLTAMKPYQDRAFRAARCRDEHDTTDAYAYDGLMGLALHDFDHHRRASASTSSTNGRADSAHATEPAPAGAGRTARDSTGRRRCENDTTSGATRCAERGDDTTLFPAGTGDVGRTAWGGADRSNPATATTSGTPPDGSGTDHDRDAVLAGCLRPGPRAKLIVRVDHLALVRGYTVPGETCEIAGIGPIPVATARELARDAFLTAVLTDGVDITKVVHLGRSATAHQRTALEARGMTCAVPGCGMAHGLEIDHVDGWAITRKTCIDQLDWLCHFHHGQKTNNSFRLAGPPGARTWHPPDEQARGG